MPIDLYMAIRRAAYIDILKQTKAGREYLEKAARLRITTVDAEGINAMKKALNRR